MADEVGKLRQFPLRLPKTREDERVKRDEERVKRDEEMKRDGKRNGEVSTV